MGEHFQPKPANRLHAAINKLLASGKHVERAAFPPLPLPGLWNVDGRELTEMQLINLAESTP